MSTVKDYKKFIQAENKKNCPSISGKKKAELKRLATNLGYKEPEKKAKVKKAPAKKKAVVKKKPVDKSKFKTKDDVMMTTNPMDLKQFLGKMKTLTENFEKEYKKVVDKLLKPIQGKKSDDHKEKVKKVMDEYNNNFVKKDHPLVKKAKDEIKKINTFDFSNDQLFSPIIKAENKQFNRVKRAIYR